MTGPGFLFVWHAVWLYSQCQPDNYDPRLFVIATDEQEKSRLNSIMWGIKRLLKFIIG